jgi:carboxyl-terminal processing protease
MVVAIAVIIGTIGTGFYRDILAKSDETYKGLRIFADVIDLIEKNYVDPVETKKLIKNAIEGMVRGLDPHSTFLPPDAYKELRIDTHGEFTGIGISITMRNGFVTVISPIEGTPAYRAGIKAMDKIIKVDGKEVTDLTKAVKMIRGPKGSTVVITVRREDVKEPIEFKIVRDIIPIESVRSLILKPGYGYIWITNFRDKTTEDLNAALEELERDSTPLKGLILDLRDNPGGLLDQAISVSDLFLKSGKILSIKGRLEKHTKIFTARDQITDRRYPMVVLINGGSASASEIVAGALQDHKRALILGTTSFGKGSVQTVESLRDGYGLKITIARYYTPSGRSIQAKGIEPDVIVKRRFVDENAEAFDEGLLKEKDLKDHLEEKRDDPEKSRPESRQKKNDKDKSKKREIRFRHGPPTIENLQEDHQVMRALEILVSYEIFKGSTSG